MAEFKSYRRKDLAELRPYSPGEGELSADGRKLFVRDICVSISASDSANGSPKLGDMIARNPKQRADQWLVAAEYFAQNFEPIE